MVYGELICCTQNINRILLNCNTGCSYLASFLNYMSLILFKDADWNKLGATVSIFAINNIKKNFFKGIFVNKDCNRMQLQQYSWNVSMVYRELFCCAQNINKVLFNCNTGCSYLTSFGNYMNLVLFKDADWNKLGATVSIFAINNIKKKFF